MSQGAPVISRPLIRAILLGEPLVDPKGRAMMEVPPERPAIAEPENEVIPAYSAEDQVDKGKVVDSVNAINAMIGNPASFPTESVFYKSDLRDYDISLPYDRSLTIRPPVFRIAVTFDTNSGPDKGKPSIILHRGRDRTGVIYGSVDSLDRHTIGTVENHAFNPGAIFPTTKVDIDAHITKEYCNYSFSMPSPADPSQQLLQRFQWRQCESAPEVMDLARSRPEGCESHDWCWIDRKNERGMKLFYIPPSAPGYDIAERSKPEKKSSFFSRSKDKKVDSKLKDKDAGQCLAVFVAGKTHSKMNPMKVAARVRWFEDAWAAGGVDGLWGEEGKVAAMLALMTYGEKTRRVGTGAGF